MTNRYLCDALEDMRMCFKTRNFSYLEGLIEEVQSMGNRMESAIRDKKDCGYLVDDIKRLIEQKKKLKKQKKKLEKEVEKLEKEIKKLEPEEE